MIIDMNVYVRNNVITYPQFYLRVSWFNNHVCGGLCRHTWERTHAITLNTTTPVPPWKIFIIIDIYLFIFYARLYLIIPNVTN